MKRFQRVVFALSALCAFGAIMASSSFAEETLLAEWLANGAAITTSLATTSTGGITLEDTETLAGKASVLCEGILVGNVGADGEGETTEVQNLAKEKIGVLGGLALLCSAVSGCAAATEASPIEVWPVGLPWKILLWASFPPLEFLILVYWQGAGGGGYELLCLVLGLNVEDTCTGPDLEFGLMNDADTGDVALPAGATSAPAATCTQSGKATGLNIVDALTSILLTSGELLTVSE